MPRTELFVGNLDRDIQRKEIETVFEKYGRLLRCDIKNKGNGPAYCFLEFEEERDAEDALRAENGKDLSGQSMVVEWAKARGDRRDGFRGSRDGGFRSGGGRDRGGFRGGRGGRGGECYECGERGHFARDCRRRRDGGGGRDRGDRRNGDRDRRDRDRSRDRRRDSNSRSRSRSRSPDSRRSYDREERDRRDRDRSRDN